MGRKKKIQHRIKRLEELALDSRAYCTKHKEYINIYDLYRNKCYTGNRGKTYCRYLRLID